MAKTYYNVQFKVVVVGHRDAGKTAILNRISQRDFDPGSTMIGKWQDGFKNRRVRVLLKPFRLHFT